MFDKKNVAFIASWSYLLLPERKDIKCYFRTRLNKFPVPYCAIDCRVHCRLDNPYDSPDSILSLLSLAKQRGQGQLEEKWVVSSHFLTPPPPPPYPSLFMRNCSAGYAFVGQ